MPDLHAEFLDRSDVRLRARINRKRQRNQSANSRIFTRAGIGVGWLLQVLVSVSLSLTLQEKVTVVHGFSSTRHPLYNKLRSDTAILRPNSCSFTIAPAPDCNRVRRRPYSQRWASDNDNSLDEPSEPAQDADPKEQAISSALSQPDSKDLPISSTKGNSLLPPPLNPPRPSATSKKEKGDKPTKTTMRPLKKILHAPANSKNNYAGGTRSRKQRKPPNNSNNANNRPAIGSKPAERDRYASMLPPPLRDPSDYVNKDEDGNANSSSPNNDQGSLSSWEQFLGAKDRSSDTLPSSPSPSNKKSSSRGTRNASENSQDTDDDEQPQPPPSMAKLPSIHDLFPPDLSSAGSKKSGATNDNGGAKRGNVVSNRNNNNSDTNLSPSQAKSQSRSSDRRPAAPNNSRFNPSTVGIPPSADRQRQPSSPKPETNESPFNKNNNSGKQKSSPPSKQQEQQQSSSLEGVLPVSDLFYRSEQSTDTGGDDEELPFSAEQTDQVAVDHNKVKIRRNQAGSNVPDKKNRNSGKSNATKKSTATGSGSRASPSGRRRMVRRGMEMLVGGVAINADPPQRNIELWYDTTQPWYAAISVNSRDFGPFFHSDSQHLLHQTELGLFCEFFVHNAMKWDVCPKELRSIVQEHLENEASEDEKIDAAFESAIDFISSNTGLLEEGVAATLTPEGTAVVVSPEYDLEFKELFGLDISEIEALTSMKGDGLSRGFGKPSKAKKKKKQKQKKAAPASNSEECIQGAGDLNFVIGVTQEELESGGSAWRDVLRAGIWNCFNKELQSAAVQGNDIEVDEIELRDVALTKLEQKETDDGLTSVTMGFSVTVKPQGKFTGYAGKHMKRLHTAMKSAVDDGDLCIALAAAAKEEERWSPQLRERIYEEFLFEEDAEDSVVWDEINQLSVSQLPPSQTDTTAERGDSAMPDRDDDLMFGASNGVIWDYSQGNAENAPFQGKLGPRLVEAMEARSKEHPPKVITVGDVHGCIDELQDLLRQCDYNPGDLVVFLGDLVSKGPDSISVVQMSREIGTIGVRGNHDFEVIRWHQAIKSGVDPPVVGSEHYHVASCLSKADIKWLYSLPWFITSTELSALFVHAGFVSGIRLQKQNPRLMMNMRSILPDGTVTSKFFNNWPWARLWDGPQTVYFGHDADRGLQQYEHAIGLDTGCVYGGRLTACILPEKRLVSVSARREYFKYRRKHYD